MLGNLDESAASQNMASFICEVPETTFDKLLIKVSAYWTVCYTTSTRVV